MGYESGDYTKIIDNQTPESNRLEELIVALEEIFEKEIITNEA